MSTVKNNFSPLISREENQLNLRESYSEIEFWFLEDADAVTANNDNFILINYCVLALFISLRLKTM